MLPWSKYKKVLYLLQDATQGQKDAGDVVTLGIQGWVRNETSVIYDQEKSEMYSHGMVHIQIGSK